MLEEKIFLTPRDILEKEFKIDARGFRPQEVDQFLDIIIRDYTEYITIIKRYETEMKNLASDNAKLKAEIRELSSRLEIAGTNKGTTNVDILRRLGELEKIVYGNE